MQISQRTDLSEQQAEPLKRGISESTSAGISGMNIAENDKRQPTGYWLGKA